MYPIITIDYEIYGDGSGDILKTVVDPMKKISKICDRYRYKVVIFFEVAEYIAMKTYARKNEKYRYKIKIMELQLRDLKEKGHDIQLHFHPQFIRSYIKGDSFIVDESAFTFEKLLNGNKNSKRILNGYLKEGIETIQDILREPNHRIIAFRAGGWNIKPAEIMIPVLKKLNVKIDSSGVKGAVMMTGKHSYDYRGMFDNIGPWWTKEDSINEVGPKGKNLMEMPIFSKKINTFNPKKFILLKRGARLASKHGPTSSSLKIPDLKAIYYSMISDVKWDFCKMDVKTMSSFFEEARLKRKNDGTMVMIGHTKDYRNDDNFNKFLAKMHSKGQDFYTFQQVYDIFK